MTPHSSAHHQILKQALQQQMVRERNVSAAISPKPMKRFLPWVVAMPLVGASLVAVVLVQHNRLTPSPTDVASNTALTTLSLSDFIRTAEAATAEQPAQVLHQKSIASYLFDGSLVTHQLETWHGQNNYADIVYNAAGEVQDKHVEVYDVQQDKHRGFDLHAIDPISNPVDQSAGEGPFCTINAADFPELSFEQQLGKLHEAFSSHNQQDRFTRLRTLLDQGKLIDLGLVDDQRGVELKTTTGLRYQYWFDAQDYTLKSHIEYASDGQVERQEQYTMDEYLDQDEATLPIFTDLTSLTEIHLYTDPIPADAPSGCYNAQGDKVSDLDVDVTVDEDGNMTITEPSAMTTAE